MSIGTTQLSRAAHYSQLQGLAAPRRQAGSCFLPGRPRVLNGTAHLRGHGLLSRQKCKLNKAVSQVLGACGQPFSVEWTLLPHGNFWGSTAAPHEVGSGQLFIKPCLFLLSCVLIPLGLLIPPPSPSPSLSCGNGREEVSTFSSNGEELGQGEGGGGRIQRNSCV